MQPVIGVREGAWTAAELASHSRAALDRPLECEAELTVAIPRDRAVVAGAFQRGPRGESALLRGSGGANVEVGPGVVWLSLALVRPAALFESDAPRLLNRYVRPVLRALTRGGALAHYFGRDWLSAVHRPIAAVSFGYDAATGRALFEAFLAVDAPVWRDDARASFGGKRPATLAELGGASSSQLAAALPRAYVDAAGRTAVALGGLPGSDDEGLADDRPWAATRPEAVGVVAAGPDRRGVLRVGGDLQVARDAVARLEARLASSADPTAIGAAVDEELGPPRSALFGVRDLASVRDAILEARLKDG